MRYRLYKIKEEGQNPQLNLLLHDTSEGRGMYLYIYGNQDFFSQALEGVQGWRFKEENRLGLVDYDLIEEFDDPNNSIVFKEEYENTLFLQELAK